MFIDCTYKWLNNVMYFILWVLTYKTKAKTTKIQLNTAKLQQKQHTKKKKYEENNEDIELRCRTSERMQKKKYKLILKYIKVFGRAVLPWWKCNEAENFIIKMVIWSIYIQCSKTNWNYELFCVCKQRY